MDKTSKIYVAGHSGLAGSAIVRKLRSDGCSNLVMRTHAELDLTNEPDTRAFFEEEKPDYVFLAAAKVGGILANSSFPAEFIRENLLIQANVIHASYTYKVRRLLFLGSSCIYPKLAPQPIKETCLLTGPLEPTNRAYALAKIAGIEMCWSCNRQYGTRYLSAMPTNLYGPGDNYHAENSHVIPALIRKFHEAKERGAESVVVWGTGTPRREFLYSEDMADACVFLMNLPDKEFDAMVGRDAPEGAEFQPPLINIGMGHDLTIKELAETIQKIVGYGGTIVFDTTKPDGTQRKLLDTSLLDNLGWRASTSLEEGLRKTYSPALFDGPVAA
jgi:GDP-L-fucose synthase